MILDFLLSLGISYSLVIVGVAAVIIGSLAGFLSFFFVNNGRSILGDTIAHSSLAGVAVAYLLVGTKSLPLFLAGALISAFLSVGFFQVVRNSTKLKEETAIGITLSIFFAVGIALLTYIQNIPSSSQAGLVSYIFGNIAFIRKNDITLLFTVESIVLLTFAFLWKEFKLILFDRELALALGFRVKLLELIQLLLVTTTIVVGIQTIGVVLIAGMLIGPAVAARQWSDRYGTVILLSAFFGVISGILGVYTSSVVLDVPPGPIIIVYVSLLVLISLAIGYRHGVLTRWLHRNLFHRRVDHQKVLENFLSLTNNLWRNRGLTEFEFKLSMYPALSEEFVRLLERCGYCKVIQGDKCALTLKGVNALRNVETKEEGGA